MSRDGSSGGTIRLAIITEEGVERIFVPGDKLPREFLTFYTLHSRVTSTDLAAWCGSFEPSEFWEKS
jgi:20S proteasome subunit beta 1